MPLRCHSSEEKPAAKLSDTISVMHLLGPYNDGVRKAIEDRSTSGVANGYPALWAVEFRVADSADYERSRKQVAEDMTTDFKATAGGLNPAFLFHLGDVVYGPGKESHYGERFYTPYRRYPGKIIANIHVSWLDPQKVRKMIIVGSRKMVVYDDVADNKIAIYDKGIDRKAILGENVTFRLRTLADARFYLDTGGLDNIQLAP